jgi:hypothetical protein
VVRLGVPGALRRTPATTNPIESAPSGTRRVTARVTRWRDGDMRRRWCVAGLLRAEGQFRRVKGHRAMPALLKAQEAVVRDDWVESGVSLRKNPRREPSTISVFWPICSSKSTCPYSVRPLLRSYRRADAGAFRPRSCSTAPSRGAGQMAGSSVGSDSERAIGEPDAPLGRRSRRRGDRAKQASQEADDGHGWGPTPALRHRIRSR